MIPVTRLNDRRLILNAEQIKTIEETPDTLITLLNGDQLLVREPMAEVVRQAIEYQRTIRTFRAAGGEPPTSQASPPDKDAAPREVP